MIHFTYFVSFFFFFKILEVKTDGSLLVQFFTYTTDKGYRLNEEVKYTITVADVLRVIEPPILKHISKR